MKFLRLAFRLSRLSKLVIMGVFRVTCLLSPSYVHFETDTAIDVTHFWKISISTAETRWWSCVWRSRRDEINLNCLQFRRPLEIILNFLAMCRLSHDSFPETSLFNELNHENYAQYRELFLRSIHQKRSRASFFSTNHRAPRPVSTLQLNLFLSADEEEENSWDKCECFFNVEAENTNFNSARYFLLKLILCASALKMSRARRKSLADVFAVFSDVQAFNALLRIIAWFSMFYALCDQVQDRCTRERILNKNMFAEINILFTRLLVKQMISNLNIFKEDWKIAHLKFPIKLESVHKSVQNAINVIIFQYNFVRLRTNKICEA